MDASIRVYFLGALWPFAGAFGQPVLPDSRMMPIEADSSAQMVAGIGISLDRAAAGSIAGRAKDWTPNYAGRAVYERSVESNRQRFATMIGLRDPRVPAPEMDYVSSVSSPAKVAETDRFVAYAVRWPVLPGVDGEGLLLEPKGKIVAQVVAVPDADQLPETVAGIAPGLPVEQQFARRLAESGCRVIVLALVDRSDRFSGNPALPRFTNQPHREWIYRQAFVMGRHVIGYEVEKIQSAIDWLQRPGKDGPSVPTGVAGWGEGGLLAFYAAAVDSRIEATIVSGYFGPRERLWTEPIYRNVFGLLKEFGDAEIARLVVPRTLLVEYSPAPSVEGPPLATADRAGAASGRIGTPAFAAVEAEFARARQLTGAYSPSLHLLHGSGDAPIGPFATDTIAAFLSALGQPAVLAPPGRDPVELRAGFDPIERQHRQVFQLQEFTQKLIASSRGVRDDTFWKKNPPTTPAAWDEAMAPYRRQMWDEVIGRLPSSPEPLNPRTRQIIDRPHWTGYEVKLDVSPDVFAWGYLLLPKDLKPGEKRPVVVVQHGLEGVPADMIEERRDTRSFGFYQAVGVRLVEQGFIVFLPHNPFRGGDVFRTEIQRKGNPLGLSLFSFILAQNDRILDWLDAQPWVDPKRIAYYGFSYGGKAALRVPSLLDRYCLSICSGDFTDWVWKVATVDWPNSYLFLEEWEVGEFNLANTFSHAEMAALIAPRPFMVERGHNDVVGTDERTLFEYAKVKRLYDQLGIGDRLDLEFFNGPHQIHGVGTFRFLHAFLHWPEAGSPAAQSAKERPAP